MFPPIWRTLKEHAHHYVAFRKLTFFFISFLLMPQNWSYRIKLIWSRHDCLSNGFFQWINQREKISKKIKVSISEKGQCCIIYIWMRFIFTIFNLDILAGIRALNVTKWYEIYLSNRPPLCSSVHIQTCRIQWITIKSLKSQQANPRKGQENKSYELIKSRFVSGFVGHVKF